jgi:hypothetical protein
VSRPGKPWGEQAPTPVFGTEEDVAILVKHVRMVAAELCAEDMEQEQKRVDAIQQRRQSQVQGDERYETLRQEWAAR